MTQTQVDLRRLAVDRADRTGSKPARRRPWISRYVVPGVVLCGFAGLLTVAARDQFDTGVAVTVVPVIVTRAEVQQEGTPLFQAAGWVEPRPTPVNVAALTEGIVEKLLVVEGQDVESGEPVARLIDVDARLALRQAHVACDLQRAETERAQAELKAARLRVEQPVHLEAALAEAESLLAKNETARAQIPFLIESAEARREYARLNLEGKQAAKDALAGRLLQEAQSQFADARAQVAELTQRAPRLAREGETLRRKVEALSAQRRLLIDEARELASAKARLQAAEASLSAARIRVETAQLALDRTTIVAPIAGRVLRLVAHPGARVMGLDTTAALSSSTVITMYDPAMLQVRADVRLEDVPLVQAGQPVQIATASAKQPLAGTVLLATSSANIQKNTLEVKVAIADPPPAIRPEMLVTATFLAPPQAHSTEEPYESERLLIPRKLVQTGEAGPAVWMVADDGTAKRQSITLGRAGSAELVEVVEGLRPTDKLISTGQQGLEPGMRVRIAGEDPALGLAVSGA